MKKIERSPKTVYRTWKHVFAVSKKKPVRMSAKIYKGKFLRLGYVYVTFSRPEQFLTWLEKHWDNLYDVVDLYACY